MSTTNERHPLTLNIFEGKAWANPVEIAIETSTDPTIVRKWIEANLLPAVNVAGPDAERPRWKISEAGWLQFATARASSAPPAKPKRRKRQRQVVDLSKHGIK